MDRNERIDAAETAFNAWSRGIAYDKATFMAGYNAALREQPSEASPASDAVERVRPFMRHNPSCLLYANAVKYDCSCGMREALAALEDKTDGR